MEYIIPEQVGIKSENILKFINKLNDAGLNMHSVLLARHGKVCFEGYWKPFHKNFAHRLYSVTKSFVSIAIGFLVQDGLVDINERILKYFPDMEQYIKNDGLKNQTVRDMLMMATASDGYNWFAHKPKDRVKNYFETISGNIKTPGTIFTYDSNGSFILCAMVERISGQPLLEFLQKRLFNKIGMSKNIECLKCPGGHSWGDSSFIMTPSDLLKFAMFVMNDGCHNGEQILDKKYVIDAKSKQIDNSFLGDCTCNNQGYGYQIWRTYDNSFAFFGMGNQEVICVPDKDLIFICNADNQGIEYARKLIIDSFFELISRKIDGEILSVNTAEYEKLRMCTSNLTLSAAKGAKSSPYAEIINGKIFTMAENPMGIKQISLNFTDNAGSIKYINAQGNKEIKFGMCENIFDNFPQTGYSDEVANTEAEGNTYKCASSAAWIEEKKLYVKVQIIDKYFGNLNIIFGFNEQGEIGVCMKKFAEDFMEEYNGFAIGK